MILLLCISGSLEFPCSNLGSSPGTVPVTEVLMTQKCFYKQFHYILLFQFRTFELHDMR